MKTPELGNTVVRTLRSGVLVRGAPASVWLVGLLGVIAIYAVVAHCGPFETDRFVENVTCRSDSTQTYALYLPPGYPGDRTWPALLVFDPRGRSVPAAERFREAAGTYGWIILSSNDTRSDGAWEPNVKALEAMWPEVHSRFAVDHRRIYAAGFSGGVLVAWYLAQVAAPHRLAGVLASGGRPAPEIPVGTIQFAHFGTAGHFDFNYVAMKLLDQVVERRGAPRQLRTFEGRHQWMPQRLAFEGVEWMEILAMKSQLRDRDARLLERVFQKWVAEARALESSGQSLEALRRYVTIADTWDGLRSVVAVRKTIQKLDQDPAVARQLEDERRAEQFEAQSMERVAVPLRELEEGQGPDAWEDYVDELQVHALKRRATEPSPTGVAAQRVLEWMFARTSFYMTRAHLKHQRFAAAATVLRIAAEIHPGRPSVWYNLACAFARHGDEKSAIEALRRAIENGYDDLTHMQADPDLEPIRSSPAYERATAPLRD